MKNIILRVNAIPVYGFLSVINNLLPDEDKMSRYKILDCGAGGPVPPLALFHQHGFEAWGIDKSDEQLNKAMEFCEEQSLGVNFCKGDMRHIPFESESFDYVYEHYSMCHLSKQDTTRAVNEMFRVLRKGGLCFMGVIADDSWPKSSFGLEKNPGEYWMGAGDEEPSLHSLFTDQETDELVLDWEIISSEKRVKYIRDDAAELSMEKWMELYPEADDKYSKDEWRSQHKNRANKVIYAHRYFILRKP